MPKIAISAHRLKQQVEQKAFAYGTPPAVAALLGEYVIDLLREATTHHHTSLILSTPYGIKNLA
jgi:hypothetical protein